MAIKIIGSEFAKLTKETFRDRLVTYITENMETSVRKTRSEDAFDKPSWSEYQAYQLGFQKAFQQLLDFIPPSQKE